MPVEYRITPAGFGWLTRAFPDSNAISPFAAFAKVAADFNDQDKESLISQGVVAPDGTIKPSALAAFNVLSGADGFSRIRVMGTAAPVDKVVYFKGNTACSVDSAQGYFSVAFPAVNREAIFMLEEFTGSSRLVNIPFHTSLSPKAAFGFLALLDLHRAANLCALAGEPKDTVFNVGRIIEKATTEGNSLIWFVNSLKKLTGAITLNEADVPAAVSELQKKNLAAEKEGGVCLAGDGLELATAFLIPEYVFSIGYGRMISDSSCEHSECSVIFCGMHNLLYIDTDRDSIIIETMSGSELLKIMANALQGMG